MTHKLSILIVEDEPDLRRGVELALKTEFKVLGVGSYAEAATAIKQQDFDLAVLDMMLGGAESGLDVLRLLKQTAPSTQAIMLTGMDDLAVARQALALGAFDYLSKPLDAEHLLHTLRSAAEKKNLKNQLAAFKDQLQNHAADFVADSVAMGPLVSALPAAAQSEVPVLLLGESGTGKEVLAQLIYKLSGRSGAFVAIHCGAIPENLMESALFGVEKGAYTDAGESRPGKFELAQNGVLFLDEVGTMPLSLQIKLLRVLQEKSFERVGGTRSITSNVKVIAATNEALRDRSDRGEFRLDLYHRLAGVVLTLPPLRERGADILTLARQTLERCSRKYHKPFKHLDSMVEKALLNYAWPGNVRELQHVIEQSVLLHSGNALSAGMLPDELWQQQPTAPANSTVSEAECFRVETDDYKTASEAFERFLLKRALAKCNGNQSKAAVLMNISRSTLTSKLAVLGLGSEKP